MPLNELNNADYISKEDYNAICNELKEAKNSRGLPDNGPSSVAAGQVITRSHVQSLQNDVKETIRYEEATVYPFTPVSTAEKPLSKIYNEVRQVVIDLQTNQRCVKCSNMCRENCELKCYASCGEGCSNSCEGGCSINSCSKNCGTKCTNKCFYSTCSSLCRSSNCTGNCYAACSNSCTSNCSGSCSGSSRT